MFHCEFAVAEVRMAEFAGNKLGSRQIALLAGAISKFFQSASYNVMNFD
jgi:hypothetical protein